MEIRKFEFAFGTKEDLFKLIKKFDELQKDEEFPDFLWEYEEQKDGE